MMSVDTQRTVPLREDFRPSPQFQHKGALSGMPASTRAATTIEKAPILVSRNDQIASRAQHERSPQASRNLDLDQSDALMATTKTVSTTRAADKHVFNLAKDKILVKDQSMAGSSVHSPKQSPKQSPKYIIDEPIAELPENQKKYTAFSVKKSSALDMNAINKLKKQNQGQYQLIQNLQEVVK